MKTITAMKTLISVTALVATMGSAWADGTIAGTDIENTATISYSVGGTAQADIKSAPGAGNSTPGTAGTPTTFVVDRKVDLNVTAASTASVNIVPSSTADQTFTLTNEGNDIEYFELTHLDGTSDQFNATSCTKTVTAVTGTHPAVGANPAIASTGSATGSVLRLAADGTATITLTCTAPATPVNGNTADVSLVATAVTASGGSTAVQSSTDPEDPAVKDTVVADAAGSATGDVVKDAKHSATVKYLVSTATLNVKKVSAVISDPTNELTNPKRIPGAVIKSTITVKNTAAAADHLKIADLIPTDLTYVATAATINGNAVPACTITGDGVVNAAAPDAGLALDCSLTGNTLSTTSFTIPVGTTTSKTATLTFYATVN